MRRIYLIRHARPDFPLGEKYCLGRTDIPLGTVGKMQAFLLSGELAEIKFSGVYSSTLKRAGETAAALSSDYTADERFCELDCGEWDGLNFREIRARWPELYEKRGTKTEVQMPGSESFSSGLERMSAGIGEILSKTSGNIAIVAHGGINSIFAGSVSGVELSEHRSLKTGYCGYYIIDYDGGFHLAGTVKDIHPELNEAACLELLRIAGCPDRAIKHCVAVKDKAEELYSELKKTGLELDGRLINNAALLHDIMRTEKNHAAAGADILNELGYRDIADIIRVHHSFSGDEINEAAVVFIADKLVKDEKTVSLEERFRLSAEKCTDDAGRQMHDMRFKSAVSVKKMINTVCRREIIS